MLKQNVTGLEFCSKKTSHTHIHSLLNTQCENEDEEKKRKKNTKKCTKRQGKKTHTYAYTHEINEKRKKKKTTELCRLDWVYGKMFIINTVVKWVFWFACSRFRPFHSDSRPTISSFGRLLKQAMSKIMGLWSWNNTYFLCILSLSYSHHSMISYTSIGFGYINICYDKNGHNR